VVFNELIQRVSGEVVITDLGYVSDGEFRGGSATGVLTLLNASGLMGACATPEGVTQLQGTYTLQIVDLF
jgi:hypothetical protein